MNKLIFTLVAILLLNFLPLIGRPELMLHYKTMVLALAAASLWLSQPAFKSSEMKRDQGSDRFSILVILLMTSLSVVAAVWEWAYRTDPSVSSLPLTLAGAALLVSGIFIRVWAIQTLGKHFTATVTLTEGHRLVRSGPYRLVRHPSYLGAFAAIVGTPVFLNAHWAILVAVLAMSLAYYLRIGVEEKMLLDNFGQEYQEYMQHTKRIIPFIW
ncbi:MAG TPA: isoprenylcysteine carboxylmethyltransferase family protein [Sediminibacterium sp.]|nr:isoprenylcysteine carboxylmethyltransferase family protein [Sediminibacterium sp.]